MAPNRYIVCLWKNKNYRGEIMDRSIDNMLENIFGGVYLQLNIIIGILLIIVGAVSLISLKGQKRKWRTRIAWASICIGCLGTLNAIIQLRLS